MHIVGRISRPPGRPRQPSQGTKQREKNLKCPVCPRRCTRPCELEEHLDMHSGVKRETIVSPKGLLLNLFAAFLGHSCVCGYKTTYRSNLTRHRHTCKGPLPSPPDESLSDSLGSSPIDMPIDGMRVEMNTVQTESQHSTPHVARESPRSNTAFYPELISTDAYHPPASYPSPSSTQYEPISPLEEDTHQFPIHSQSSHQLFSSVNHSTLPDYNMYGSISAYDNNQLDMVQPTSRPPTVQFPSSSVRSPAYPDMQYAVPREVTPNSLVTHPESRLRAIGDHFGPHDPSMHNSSSSISRRFAIAGIPHYASPSEDPPHLPHSSYSYPVNVDPN
ncbi:hypothetical protein BS47DRAFT_1360352 [Hydnum rufescens UP504]|uniref:C2H2-type domain-containing protein n=1 Tax=Hydnum rufescens UP504 TaxID=1448309 RepID=A0A9P6DVD7_9AGAM|nr:hypothetical protein BS47DRAFT_1360352 [Hydnum rufescens UP504]